MARPTAPPAAPPTGRPVPGIAIEPLSGPLDHTVALPGSKSLTNRALVAASLADGRSRLTGALFADDTEAMLESLSRLRVRLVADPGAATVDVDGAGLVPDGSFTLDCRLSGTTSRFLLPVVALGAGHYEVDGAEPLRRRPMTDGIEALRSLGSDVEHHGAPGHLPLTISGGPVLGGTVTVPGDTSSQFLSGLLLAAPAMAEGLRVGLSSTLVSRPYVDMTIAVMAHFGVEVERPDDSSFVVPPTRYRAADLMIEPDASAASYFFAAAAIGGGRVRVEGLGAGSLQGDLGFLNVLERMGATVERSGGDITVTGTGGLRGGTFDCSAISDTAQTLAVTAVFAEGPTRLTGIDFIRRKETDRIAAVVTELRRCGIEAEEEADGLVVHPGRPQPTVVHTYDDHRMAMSFALLGLRVPGIVIADPGCVAKTFPDFFSVLERLGQPDRVRRR